MVFFPRPTPVFRRLSYRQQSRGWSVPAGRDSTNSNPISRLLMFLAVVLPTVLVCRRVHRFRCADETFPRLQSACNRHLASVACLDLSVRLATVRLTSVGSHASPQVKAVYIVGFRQPVMIRQQSCRAGFSLFACVDLVHTTHVFSAVE